MEEKKQVANDLRTEGFRAVQESASSANEEMEALLAKKKAIEAELKSAKKDVAERWWQERLQALKEVGEKLLRARMKVVNFLKGKEQLTEEEQQDRQQQFEYLKDAVEMVKALQASGEDYAEKSYGEATLRVYIGKDKMPIFLVEYPETSYEKLNSVSKRVVLYNYGKTGVLNQHNLEMSSEYIKDGLFGKVFMPTTVHTCSYTKGFLQKDKFIYDETEEFGENVLGFGTHKGDLIKMGESVSSEETPTDMAYFVPKSVSAMVAEIMAKKRESSKVAEISGAGANHKAVDGANASGTRGTEEPVAGPSF